jgi:protein-export membrane protein SecD
MLLIIAAAIGYFVYISQNPGSTHQFRLGLDLSGGTHLVYQADVSKLASEDIKDSMSSLRDVVERRVNMFGVSEPLVQTEQAAALSSKESAYKLIVELPGVTDVDEAVRSIGATPSLEFKLLTADQMRSFQASSTSISSSTELEAAYLALFKPTGLTGSMVAKAALEFNNTTNQPVVGLTFTSEGRDLFSKITKDNIGNYLGIFLDGKDISVPVIRDQISDGKGQISGTFTLDEAKKLVRDLNYGALPVPITLISTQTIGPSLGEASVKGGLKAGVIAFIIIAIFLIIWYRLPGVVAVVALGCYIALNLAIFKIGVSPALFIIILFFGVLSIFWHRGFLAGIPISYVLLALVPGGLSPVTLTATGIAGFILSIGMAVDANILIFERMREELARGASIWDAMHQGFDRAWLSIRDSNTSSIITGIILYEFGSSAVITGFALVFVVGVVVSMFTAITASRLFLYAVAPSRASKFTLFLVNNGFFRRKSSI